MSDELTSFVNNIFGNLDHCAAKSAAIEAGLSHMCSTYGEIAQSNWWKGNFNFFGLDFFRWLYAMIQIVGGDEYLLEEVQEYIEDYL